MDYIKLYNQKQMAYHASRIAKFEPNWVIVGGESGPGARPVILEWVTDIRESVPESQSPIFLQAMGWCSEDAKRTGRTLEGRTWNEMPMNLVRV